MKFILVNKTGPVINVSSGSVKYSEVAEVGAVGGNSLAIVLKVTLSSGNCQAQLQGSIDGVDYVDIPDAAFDLTVGNLAFMQPQPVFKSYRVSFFTDDGVANVIPQILIKGDKE